MRVSSVVVCIFKCYLYIFMAIVIARFIIVHESIYLQGNYLYIKYSNSVTLTFQHMFPDCFENRRIYLLARSRLRYLKIDWCHNLFIPVLTVASKREIIACERYKIGLKCILLFPFRKWNPFLLWSAGFLLLFIRLAYLTGATNMNIPCRSSCVNRNLKKQQASISDATAITRFFIHVLSILYKRASTV